MYLDQLFIALGAGFALVFVVLVTYLIISGKKSRLFRRILDKETEAFETLSATFSNTSASVHLGDISIEMPEEFTVLEDNDATQAQASPLKAVTDFNPETLHGQYELLGEIEGGGMSRVFLAKKTNIGNEWIVKYVPSAIGELTNEAEILKSLNHISLPKIIDIFKDSGGLYIVQSYIEGVGLNRVLRANDGIHEFVVLDWAQQLAQVLSYLHARGPVLHLDLKPSNIIVTHDNKLVLIDFGISRFQDDASDSIGATVSYAAPEQLKKIGRRAKEIVTKRFGSTLPEARENWQLDERTDIYSFGVIMFEAAVGHIPTLETMHRLRNHVSPGFCEIIYKCLAVNPSERYQTTEELLAAINNQQANAKPNMLKTLIARKAAVFASAASIALAVFGFAYGLHTMRLEVMASMHINPSAIMVSLHQSSEIAVTRLVGGVERHMDAANLRWEFSDGSIAQVDGNRIIGLNPGETTIHGYYRNAAIQMHVSVVEPMHGLVDISLRYRPGYYLNLFAGTDYRDWIDGDLAQAEFVSPESLARAESGAVYITDSGRLRRMYGGEVETIEINPAFLRPHIVRTYGNDVYILTSPWQDDYGFFYGIIRLTEHGGEGFFLGDALFTEVRDFYVHGGLIYFIERNEGTGFTHLRTINTQNADDIRTITELPENMYALAIGGGRIFLADQTQGIVMAYENGELTHFAGAANENTFIDGTAPLFYRPTRIRYHAGNLYVWDFNILRRIEVENGAAREAVTVAGMASPAYCLDGLDNAPAEHAIMPFSHLTDFLHDNEGILITDPKRGAIWQVQKKFNW